MKGPPRIVELSLLLLSACREPHGEARKAVAAPVPDVVDAATHPGQEGGFDAHATPSLPPLEGESWLEQIPLEGGSLAFVALPLGTREPRPVVVGVHGAGDRPDWSCSEWRATTAGHAWVVCPRGVPSQWKDFWSWGSAGSIAARTEQAMRALRQKYPAYVAEGPMVYGGWSQGGTLAGSVIAAHPGMFDRAVLLEVGHTPLDAGSVVASLKAGGVKRVIVSCSSLPCRGLARSLERAAGRAGLPLVVNDVGLRGHWFDAPVFDTLGKRFPWLVEGDPRWSGIEQAILARP